MTVPGRALATRLAALSPRERLLLAALAALLAAALGWSLVWRPVAAARASAAAELSRLDIALARVRAAPVQDARAAALRARPPALAVTETAAALGLTIARLEPEGDRVTASLAEAEFETLISWIELLDTRHGLSVTALDLERRPAPGFVAVRASFGR